jgi:hypothetical protein
MNPSINYNLIFKKGSVKTFKRMVMEVCSLYIMSKETPSPFVSTG